MRSPPGRGGEELRRLFVQAALKILEDPETPLELRKVAELAGKSRTAPYLAFGRESEGGGVLALRMAVAAEGARIMSDRLAEAERSSSDPLMAFQSVARAFLAFVGEHPRLFRLMFGPEIGVSASLSREELAEHQEFANLSRNRMASERVIHRVIARCQERRIAPPGDTARYTTIAWASLLGAAFLLLDEVLEAAGIRTDLDDAASLVTESVLGLDAAPLEEATHTFLEAQAKSETPPSVPPGTVAAALLTPRYRLQSEAPEFGDAGPPKRDRPGALESVRRLFSRVEPSEAGEAEELTLAAPDAEALGAGTPGEALSRYSGLRRAAQSRKALYGARILWIDDRPDNLRAEIDTLRHLRAIVSTARSTDEAEIRLRSEAFDLIISDMAREGDSAAGTRALPRLRSWAPDTPVVFYTARIDPARGVPKGALGITDRTDELLHLIVDAMERRR
ncbi:MAG TPA: response regulator [Longimicrobiales bacterium]|nr:response regulator [Longimicrobiales bacterium]